MPPVTPTPAPSSFVPDLGSFLKTWTEPGGSGADMSERLQSLEDKVTNVQQLIGNQLHACISQKEDTCDACLKNIFEQLHNALLPIEERVDQVYLAVHEQMLAGLTPLESRIGPLAEALLTDATANATPSESKPNPSLSPSPSPEQANEPIPSTMGRDSGNGIVTQDETTSMPLQETAEAEEVPKAQERGSSEEKHECCDRPAIVVLDERTIEYLKANKDCCKPAVVQLLETPLIQVALNTISTQLGLPLPFGDFWKELDLPNFIKQQNEQTGPEPKKPETTLDPKFGIFEQVEREQ
jgi:hypothetical protein